MRPDRSICFVAVVWDRGILNLWGLPVQGNRRHHCYWKDWQSLRSRRHLLGVLPWSSSGIICDWAVGETDAPGVFLRSRSGSWLPTLVNSFFSLYIPASAHSCLQRTLSFHLTSLARVSHWLPAPLSCRKEGFGKMQFWLLCDAQENVEGGGWGAELTVVRLASDLS